METREHLEDLVLLGREVILNILKIADKEVKLAKELEDKDKEETIVKEVIPKYQSLFEQFSADIADDIDAEFVTKVEELIYKLIEDYNLDEGQLWEDVRKRLEYKGNSGAEAVKKLYEYKLKELEADRNRLLDIERQLLEKQKRLEMELADCIQEDEELKAFERLKKNSDYLDSLDKKFELIEKKVLEFRYNLESRWKYEIYGVLSKEELLEIYRDVI